VIVVDEETKISDFKVDEKSRRLTLIPGDIYRDIPEGSDSYAVVDVMSRSGEEKASALLKVNTAFKPNPKH